MSWRYLVKECIPYIYLWWHIKINQGVFFFLRLLKCVVLDQLTVNSGGVSRGRSVAVTVGCFHFTGASTALQWHFRGTSMALPQNFYSTKKYIRKTRKKVYHFFLSVSVKRYSVSHMWPWMATLGRPRPILYFFVFPPPSLGAPISVSLFSSQYKSFGRVCVVCTNHHTCIVLLVFLHVIGLEFAIKNMLLCVFMWC